jgi:methionine-rich copper-binding protein CopC
MRLVTAASLIGLLLITRIGVEAHAFPERSDPRVGAVIRTAPTEVRIWFDGDLEPAFSTLTVTDGTGRRIDRGDSHVENRRLLQVRLPPLAPGVYRVTWSVLAIDGHRTQGDYRFTLKSPE